MKDLKKYLHNPFKNPKSIFTFYVIINMIPSIFLMLTEPFNFWGRIVLLLFPIGLYLIIFSLWKKTSIIQLILFPLLFLHAFQIVLFYLFGEGVISPDMFLNVVTSNTSEAGELLNGILPAMILTIVIYGFTICLAISSTYRKIRTTRGFRIRMSKTGGGLIILSIILMFCSANTNTRKFSFNQSVYPANMIYNLFFAIKKYHRTEQYPIATKDFKFNAKQICQANKKEVFLLLIGETGRASSWQLYGYNRPTNPKLSKENGLVCFTDAITQCNATYKSVPIILSPASAENYEVIYHQKSMISAFKESGFKTVFLSNQAPNNSFTEMYWKDADFFKNYRTLRKDGGVLENNYDEIILPQLENYIDSIQGNLLIIIHSYGSHFNYKDRYPKNFSIYKPDNVTRIRKSEKNTLINAYDNSILYTDDFLDKVINILKNKDICSAMLYSPDHGEDIMDDNRFRFLHASPNPTFYQLWIPFFMWFSDNYKSQFPEKVKSAKNNKSKPVATNAIFHTMIDLANISSDYLRPDLSLVNKSFKIRKRMYINNLDKPVFFYNANLKKQDKLMIDHYKLYH